MIALLTGKILQQRLDHIIVGVHGVGYSVHVPVGTQGRLKSNEEDQSVTIHIHTHVREDALMLYGFATNEEKIVFEKLISVSGVGAKLGLAILSALPPVELVKAIETNDVSALTKISGIGKKTAQRLILELKSKIDDSTLEAIAPVDDAKSKIVEDLKSSLKNMGYDNKTIDDILETLGDKIETQSFDDLLRAAFKMMR